MEEKVPRVKYAIIGGSGTWGARFPEDLDLEGVQLTHIYTEGFDTPYGLSAPFKLLEIAGEQVLRVAMHSVRSFEGGLPSPWRAAKQVAWVFKEAGVKWAITEGSAGGLQNPNRSDEPLDVWNAIIPHDYITPFMPPSDGIPFDSGRDQFVRHGEPFCANLRRTLYEAAIKQSRFEAVYDHGVYVCAPPQRFETASEVRRFVNMGGHVVGQTMGHEAPLMRELGIHFGAFNFISNSAEGPAWKLDTQQELRQFYLECPQIVGTVIVEALAAVIKAGKDDCNCAHYVMPSMNDFPVPGA